MTKAETNSSSRNVEIYGGMAFDVDKGGSNKAGDEMDEPIIKEVSTWPEASEFPKMNPENVIRNKDGSLLAVYGGGLIEITEQDVDNPKAESIVNSPEVQEMTPAELQNLIGRLKALLK
jgi:hypothetical protein